MANTSTDEKNQSWSQSQISGTRTASDPSFLRMLTVFNPPVWAVSDVSANFIQFVLVQDDVIMIIALPNRFALSVTHLVDPFGDD